MRVYAAAHHHILSKDRRVTLSIYVLAQSNVSPIMEKADHGFVTEMHPTITGYLDRRCDSHCLLLLLDTLASTLTDGFPLVMSFLSNNDFVINYWPPLLFVNTSNCNGKSLLNAVLPSLNIAPECKPIRARLYVMQDNCSSLH